MQKNNLVRKTILDLLEFHEFWNLTDKNKVGHA